MSISLFAKLYNRFGHKPSIQEDLEKISAKINRELPAIPDGAYRPLAGHAHVAVVGGGFAGLSAAYYLTQGGFHVTMLEARDKIGGRVQTSTDLIPGRFIEAGAELIGSNHLLWMTLAKRFGLSLMVVSQDELFTGAR